MSITVPLYGFGGGGGAALDLKIIPGLDRPVNPTPNMIWVKTDKEITGYALSAEKPGNPAEGLLWLGISDSSKIKATVPVGKEYITIYFLNGAIYTSGAWENVECFSYQNGEWANWVMYLYNNGDLCESITGGWERKAYGGSTLGTVTINTENITITAGNKTIVLGCKDFDPSELSKHKTLNARYTVSNRTATNAWTRIGTMADYSMGTSGIDNEWTSATEQSADTGELTVSLDISSIANGYPAIGVYDCTLVLHKMWFE